MDFSSDAVLAELLGDVRTEPAGLGDQLATGVGVGAEEHISVRLIEKLFRFFDGQLVRRDVIGDVHPLLVPLQVGAVPADPDHDVAAG
jgi:hypothetical protein